MGAREYVVAQAKQACDSINQEVYIENLTSETTWRGGRAELTFACVDKMRFPPQAIAGRSATQLLCVVVPIKKLPGATGEFFYWVHELRLPVERKRNPLGPHNREFKDNGVPPPCAATARMVPR